LGHHQLLLVVLGVIIVSFTIAVGVTQFQTSAAVSNREAVITDLLSYAAKAQAYYRTPTQLGGGSQNFNGFALNALEKSNDNGNYNPTTSQPSGTTAVNTGGSIGASATTIYIEGSGKEPGNNAANPVKAFVTVTANSITTSILN